MRTAVRKIIIVDDVQMFIQVQKTLLNRKDFTLLTAGTGREALHNAIVEKPDLILLDLYMPDMNGDTVCRELKNSLNTKHIPILILTTDDEAETREACAEAGCDGHLTKPLSKDILIPAIESYLQIPPRRHQRVRAKIPCTLIDEDGQREGIIHTLSPGGAFIETDPPPQAGDIVQVIFTLIDTGQKLSLQASIRWAREVGNSQPDGGGCEFIGIPQEDIESIRSYLALRPNDVED